MQKFLFRLTDRTRRRSLRDNFRALLKHLIIVLLWLKITYYSNILRSSCSYICLFTARNELTQSGTIDIDVVMATHISDQRWPMLIFFATIKTSLPVEFHLLWRKKILRNKRVISLRFVSCHTTFRGLSLGLATLLLVLTVPLISDDSERVRDTCTT